jgi:hypothetical protein
VSLLFTSDLSLLLQQGPKKCWSQEATRASEDQTQVVCRPWARACSLPLFLSALVLLLPWSISVCFVLGVMFDLLRLFAPLVYACIVLVLRATVYLCFHSVCVSAVDTKL